MTLESKTEKNVAFPVGTSGTVDFSIEIEWRNKLSVRNMRKNIPLMINYEAKPTEVAEFYTEGSKNKFTSPKHDNVGFKTEVFVRPRGVRWSVGQPVPVKIVVNNKRPIRPVIRDGRLRRVEVSFLNKIITNDEYVQLTIGPLIPPLRTDPIAYLYGFRIEAKESYRYRSSFFIL